MTFAYARSILGLTFASMMLTSLPGCTGDDGGDEVGDLDDLDDAADSSSDSAADTTDSTGTSDTTDTTDTSDTTDTGEPLSFVSDVYPIIAGNCSCHVANAPGQLAMPNATTAYANLVGVASVQVDLLRVEAGNPEASHLYKKITNTQAFGARMPTTGPLLASDQLMTIEAWIAGGALE